MEESHERQERGRAGGRQVTGYRHAERFLVRSGDGAPVPVQVDGDFIGLHETAEFTVRPGGLQVVA